MLNSPDHLGEFIKTLPKASEPYIPPSKEEFRQMHDQEAAEKRIIPDPAKAIQAGGSLGTFELRTPNDDLPGMLGGKKGTDGGKSFGLGFQYRTDSIIAGMDIDGYTRNDFLDKKSRLMHGERSDHMQIYALGKAGETQMKIGDTVGNILFFAGGGVQGVGEFGMKGLQTAWHKHGPKAMTGGYNFANTYEKGSDGKGISGYTPDLRSKVEATLPLIGDADTGLRGTGSVDAKIPLSRKYGETAVKASVGIVGDYGRLHGNIGATGNIYRDMPTASRVIGDAQNNPDSYLSLGASVDLYKSKTTTASAFVNLDRDLNRGKGKPSDQGSLGIRIQKQF